MQVKKIYLPRRLSYPVCAKGDKGAAVYDIQQQLAKFGFLTVVDGVYSSDTADAVAGFQQTQGLPATGTMDPVTYCRLMDGTVFELAVKPRIERASAALPRANVFISRSQRRLTLLNGNSHVRQWPIAVGKPATPTPLGNFAIATKILNPGGVLGTRWLGLNYDAYGIHGTNRPHLIGQMVSNGCIRMHNGHVEELFVFVNIGTPVFIRD